MTEAEKMRDAIEAHAGSLKRGALRFWGAWFARPYDNGHEMISVEAEGDVLRLRFRDGGVLDVARPTGLRVHDDEFVIRDAERVRWEWRPYGSPPETARQFLEFTRAGVRIDVAASPEATPPDPAASTRHPAVEIA